MEAKTQKDELLEQIAQLIESDPEATPMSLEIMDYMSEEELSSILSNLQRAKDNRSKDNEEWFQELCKK